MDGHIGQPVGQAPKLLGNYRILHLLGQGGFADVYLGEHIHLRTQAAIKVLQVRLVENNIQSFLNEARTIAHLIHPYIVRVLDFGVEGNTPFLVMDYAPQGTFRQRFLQGKPLPPTPLFPYIKQAASALQYAHDKKLIHRDVKPENMLLGPNKEILLSDFGFALMQTSLSRPPAETAGTAAYMAPEQLQGKPQPASDQYSLGVVAYEWLTGTCPFQGTFMELASQHMLAQPPLLRQRVPDTPAEVEQVVMTALAKEPEQRFPSVRDFARALEHACLTAYKTSSSSSSSLPPPFLTTTPSITTSHTLPGHPGNSLSQLQKDQKPQPFLHSESQLRDEFGTPYLPPFSQSIANSSQPSQLNLSASFPPLPQGTANTAYISQSNIRTSSAIYPSFSQGALNVPKLSRTNPQPFSSKLTDQTVKSGSTGPRPIATPHIHTTEHFSQFDLPPLPAPSISKDTGVNPSNVANAARVPSPSWLSEQSSRSVPNLSQVELPPLPRESFPNLELARPKMQVQMASQTFPVQQKEQKSFSLASSQSLPALSPPLIRQEDFWSKPKPTTPRTIYFFVIFMVALIIGSTAILITLANNQHNTSASQQHSAHATATTASQQTATTTNNQTEQNPYGNHNGILVLNDTLSQQNPEVHWDELAGKCSFSASSYHVIASSQSEGFTRCNATTLDYSNFAYEVNMNITNATTAFGSGGIVFRANNTKNQFYFFEIFTTGAYNFYRCPGTNGGACPQLSTSTGTGPLASFHTGLNQPNTIAVVANGNTFSIYVNNQLAVGPITDTVNDPTYSHGSIGMMARQDNATAVTDVSFSDLKIWQL